MPMTCLGSICSDPQPAGSSFMPESCIAPFCLAKLMKAKNILAKDIQANKQKGYKIWTFVIQTALPSSLGGGALPSKVFEGPGLGCFHTRSTKHAHHPPVCKT